MANGLWNWNRHWTFLPASVNVVNASMRACKNKGLKEVFVTMWGDDGNECDLFSALPGLHSAHFATLQPGFLPLRSGRREPRVCKSGDAELSPIEHLSDGNGHKERARARPCLRIIRTEIDWPRPPYPSR